MNDGRAWDYRNPVGIQFGWGRLEELRRHAVGRCLIVTSPGTTGRGLTARVQGLLGHDSTLVFDAVSSNPTIDAAEAASAALTDQGIETIVAVGGGSTIDFGKVLALTLAHPHLSLRESLAEPSIVQDLRPLSLVAVPTTAGTGSEVTPFATLWDPTHRRKRSLASPHLFPTSAILDPELTLSLPWESTLAPGLDALSQCFEAIWNRNSTPLTTALAQRGLSLVPDALRHLKTDPGSTDARSDMLEASLFSGLAISRTRTALAHSISYPVTAHFAVPHGLACSFSLPALLEFNLGSDDGRLVGVASQLGCSDGQELVRFLINLFRELGVAEAFRRYVPAYAELYELIPEMITPGRADNNLRPVDSAAIRSVLETSEAWMVSG